MDYIFINTDVYLQTDIDFSKIPFENTTIVVPKFVIDEIQKCQDEEKREKILTFLNDGQNVFCKVDDDSKDITDSMTKFNCEDDKKYLVTFSTNLLSKNMYRNLLDGCDFTRQMEKATKLYQIFTENLKNNINKNAEDSKSRYYLSECYYNGKGIDKNIDEWKKELKISAEQGFDVAQYKMGVAYNNNNNFKKAEEWYEQAANKGNILAMYYLGCLYLKGAKGVEPNVDKAIKLISKAAEKDMILAKAVLGCLYYEGVYVKRDLQKAKTLLELTAPKGIVEAQNALGRMYFYGDEVKHNTEKAIQWTTMAAQKGFPEAKYNLGLYYELQKKYKDALFWYEKSAKEDNNPQAYCKLGELYELRIIKDNNPIGKATQYYQAAAQLGNEQAKANLDAINRNQYIEDAFKELNTKRIEEEHNRAKTWYSWCLGISAFLVVFLFFFICCNIHSSTQSKNIPTQNEIPPAQNKDLPTYNKTLPTYNEDIITPNSVISIIFRILATATTISFIFIGINQAARMRKSMLLLSKEIQEYEYIKGLLKAKNTLSIDSLETNKEISTTISKMIEIHLEIQKERIGKEDHTEVKDITPEMFNFWKDNTNSVLSNYNDMYKTLTNVIKGDKSK